MYCEFYGFGEKPFHITPNPRFLFLSKNHKEAFAHLLYGINNHVGFIELTGEVGTGKTTVLRTLLEQLDETSYRTALIFNPCLSALELLRSINREFGINCEGVGGAELLDELNRFLLAENREGRTVVLVIDEAQNLDPQVMEQIRLISNLETETDKLIQIILAGQPELALLLERTELRQLAQRITVRYHLLPMDFADTRAYLEHRLLVAGSRQERIFSAMACRRIYYYSGGSPRLINIACDRALLIGYSEDRRQVSGRLAAAAIRELRGRRRLVALTPRQRLWAGALMLATFLLTMLIPLSRKSSPPTTARATPPVAAPVALNSPPAPRAKETATKPKPAQPLAAPPQAAMVTPATTKAAPTMQATTTDRENAPWLDLPEGPLPAFNALARLWHQAPATAGKGRASVAGLARTAGLELSPVPDDLDTLQRLDTPAILAIKPPGTKQVRYVAVTRLTRDKARLSPAPAGQAVVSRKKLQQLWTGQGQLLWKNYQQIPPSLQPNAAGVAVIRLQILLSGAGFTQGEPSGIFDEGTTTALKAFQKAHKLKADGRPGAKTLLLLYRDGGKFFIPRLGEGMDKG
jgi:general secretion pathway protein A